MRLSRTAAFVLQASLILLFLAGSSAPSPLYAVYQSAWGFSPIMITIIFGTYALAVLATLLVAGSLSDYTGRRPVLLVATLLQVITMAIFATAHGVGALLVGRVVQGISVGMAGGAVGAGMIDIDREKGTLANSALPPLGTATGGLLAGLLAQYLPAPTVLVYVVLGVVFVGQLVALLFMPESISPQPGALASLRPRIGLPPNLRRPTLLVAPALVGAWALAGFYLSLGPTLARRLLGSHSLALGGLVVFVLAASGSITVMLTRLRPAASLVTFGAAGLIVGVGLTLLAMASMSSVVFFLGATIAGMGFGAAFQGSMRMVLPLAAPHERAGVLSVLYVIAYLAMGLPAVLAGIGVVYGGGVIATAREYGMGVMALSSLALVGTLARRRSVSTVAAPAKS
ncbi:Permease of the major facilitator superfamily [Labilithrix luteola]|uniref:Permease of the major facilitator superfamily n=1 Tax=Labilithrix luteola TaxID=1391654 RepID=A0A0K1Q4I4_9BACT|nr:MFS transporter [Labilithrix luteola]AKV00648.1 Permease of the major facilitator superfamily [Labilithrix luteola]